VTSPRPQLCVKHVGAKTVKQSGHERVIDAADQGGNAVISMRFDSSEMGQQLTEIVAYGTAVVARPSGCRLTMPEGPRGRPASRLGDADRDRLTAVLREHYALGRLEHDELSRRVEIVLAADYADQAAAALQDLPPLDVPGLGTAPGAVPGKGRRARRRRPAQSAAPGPGWLRPPNDSGIRRQGRSCASGSIRPTRAGTTCQTPGTGTDPDRLDPASGVQGESQAASRVASNA